jgi:hypothetical protein
MLDSEPPPDESAQSVVDLVPEPATIPLPPLPLPTVPTLTASGNPARNYRIPARYHDIPPEGPAPLPPAVDTTPRQPTLIRRVILHVRDHIRTGINQFGLLREYPHRPSYDPDSVVPLEELSNRASLQTDNQDEVDGQTSSRVAPWPFKNMSIYRLMEWMITGSNQKSVGEVNRLVKEVIGAKDFRVEDLQDFSAQRENKRLDDSSQNPVKSPHGGDGWCESNVTLSVPSGKRGVKGVDFSVPGLHYRPLLATIKAALADVTSRRFHFSPFRRIWKHPSGIEERIFDEAYTSDAWLDAHNTLQKQSNEPGCTLEKVILGIMFWSDSTHLTNFGTASVWPLYMYFANLSKYFRGRPGSEASHHVAYIPSVSFSDLVYEHSSNSSCIPGSRFHSRYPSSRWPAGQGYDSPPPRTHA